MRHSGCAGHTFDHKCLTQHWARSRMLAHVRYSQRFKNSIVEILDAPDDDTGKAVRRQELKDRATPQVWAGAALACYASAWPVAIVGRLLAAFQTCLDFCVRTVPTPCRAFFCAPHLHEIVTLLRTHPTPPWGKRHRCP